MIGTLAKNEAGLKFLSEREFFYPKKILDKMFDTIISNEDEENYFSNAFTANGFITDVLLKPFIRSGIVLLVSPILQNPFMHGFVMQ